MPISDSSKKKKLPEMPENIEFQNKINEFNFSHIYFYYCLNN